jgi:hypothetical protein
MIPKSPWDTHPTLVRTKNLACCQLCTYFHPRHCCSQLLSLAMFFSFLPSFCKGASQFHENMMLWPSVGCKEGSRRTWWALHTLPYSSFYWENNLSMFKVQTLNPINKSHFSRGPQLTNYKSLIILNGYFSVTLNDSIGQGPLTL